MKKTTLIMLACAGLAFTAAAQDYDVVINNGRVIDPETIRDSATPQMGTSAVYGNSLCHRQRYSRSVKDSKVLKDVFPGQPIRAAIQE